MSVPAAVDDRIADRYDDYLGALRRLVAQPSVSATGEGVADCAELCAELCTGYGFDDAAVVDTAGHPAVVAEAGADVADPEDAPTALVYGHYDVQPVDPGEWSTPPFEPTVRTVDGRELMYGRGTVDNKGQFLTYLCAVAALRATTGLPVNVVLLLDGEEESGSPNLGDAVEARRATLARADVAVNSDGPVEAPDRPTVVLGNRGILVVRVDVAGPDGDLHSGHYGGAVPNPVAELARLLGTTREASGRVAVEGFYDDVRPMTAADRELLDAFEPDPETLRAELGVAGFDDGPGETFLEKTLFHPTLNVNGIAGGHGDEGFKTIVPSSASATVDMRLVADQDPDDVFELVRDHLLAHAPDRVEVTVTRLANMAPSRTPVETPYREPIAAAVADGWGAEPVVKPSTGGSAPYAIFTRDLGLPHLSVPYGQPDNDQHAPDEQFALANFRRGIGTSARLLHAVAGVDPDGGDGD